MKEPARRLSTLHSEVSTTCACGAVGVTVDAKAGAARVITRKSSKNATSIDTGAVADAAARYADRYRRSPPPPDPERRVMEITIERAIGGLTALHRSASCRLIMLRELRTPASGALQYDFPAERRGSVHKPASDHCPGRVRRRHPHRTSRCPQRSLATGTARRRAREHSGRPGPLPLTAFQRCLGRVFRAHLEASGVDLPCAIAAVGDPGVAPRDGLCSARQAADEVAGFGLPADVLAPTGAVT